jgi:hypothetical protein
MPLIANDIDDEKLTNFVKWRNGIEGFHSFAQECLFTIDQARKAVRPYPNLSLPEYQYLKWTTAQMIEEILLAIVKHRRMIITWGGIVSISTWDTLFHEATDVAIVSKKDEDSDDLVKRCKFQLENIPRGKMLKMPEWEYKWNLITYEHGSHIRGVAQGEDQLRQYTYSRIFCDEIAFLPKAKGTFVGAKPTIEGGGKVCLVSTRFPGFFRDIIEDTINVDS